MYSIYSLSERWGKLYIVDQHNRIALWPADMVDQQLTIWNINGTTFYKEEVCTTQE